MCTAGGGAGLRWICGGVARMSCSSSIPSSGLKGRKTPRRVTTETPRPTRADWGVAAREAWGRADFRPFVKWRISGIYPLRECEPERRRGTPLPQGEIAFPRLRNRIVLTTRSRVSRSARRHCILAGVMTHGATDPNRGGDAVPAIRLRAGDVRGSARSTIAHAAQRIFR